MADTLVINEIYLSLQGESTFAGLPCIFVRLTACDLRCSYCDTAYAFTEGQKKSVEEVRAEVNRLAEPFREKPPVTADPALPNRLTSAPHSALVTPEPGEGGLRTCRTEAWRRRAPHSRKLPLVELTGGEPLLQKTSLPLMAGLCDDGFTVLLETSGAHDISPVDARVRRIMDLKCPASGEVERNLWGNLHHLKSTDEIKFVIGTREDYEWTKEKITEHKLDAICPVLLSWVHPLAPEQQHKSLKKVPAGQTPISREDLARQIIADALPVRFQIQLHKVIWPPEKRGV